MKFYHFDIHVWRTTGANLKNQCYRDYLYGKNLDLERGVSRIEGLAATVFRKIDHDVALPIPNSADHFVMILYILTQYARTTYAAEALDEMHDKMIKHLLRPMAEADGIDLDSVTIGIRDPARYSVQISTLYYPLLMDLSYKLLISEADAEFLTSDNPVVLYNQLMAFRRYGCNTGLASKGLQIYFPLDAHKALIFYDHAVYSIGSNNTNIVRILNKKDIYSLNKLQMASANDNVYFSDPTIDIKRIAKITTRYRRSAKANLDVYVKEETADIRRELMAISKNDIQTDLALSFLRLRKSAKAWRESFKKKRPQPVVVARNEVLLHAYNEFEKLVEKGRYAPSDFNKFLRDKNEEPANKAINSDT